MKIYNSLTRKKEEFVPIKSGKAGIYVCGPTVYDESHIGHARSAYIFDCIRRYLEYKKFKVTFVRNVTDVDDKIINKAKEVSRGKGQEARLPEPLQFSGGQARGKGPEDKCEECQAAGLEEAVGRIAKKYLEAYHDDMASLGISRPDREPKATEYIAKMIKFIGTLIKKGRAYESGGDVYFDIKKAPSYGKLSNQRLEKMESGARVAPGENKHDGLDFALWKKAKEGEPSWDSPWGKGRPGWHVECSVMSTDILGDEFDIHGGGIDLIFPHHENEIAQSEGAGKHFARYWLHNGLLTINGEKMAKSLGNFITIKDFINKYKDPDYLKLLFLNAHYRHPVDYTEEKIEEIKSQKERFLILFEKIEKILQERATGGREEIEDFEKRFEEAMDDDFNTPLALAVMFDMASFINKLMHGKSQFTKEEYAKIASAGDILISLGKIFRLNITAEAARKDVDAARILELIDERNLAREEKDFKKADEIRTGLSAMGVILEDTKEGTEWRLKA